ncbi:MAG TPA: protein-methionine-sulfoxide reductase catalytic subunit MsrP [Levilinea sp.]|nr:protein-methionine-sulfoxide reductase catalytic subunit MsrP [Levilinea sp.]
MSSQPIQSIPVSPSEITPEHLYLSRRRFMQLAATVGISAALAACSPAYPRAPVPTADAITGSSRPAPTEPDDLVAELTPFESITNYNNFYEFSLDKTAVAQLAQDFRTSPWEVEVYGLVNKPRTFGFEDLTAMFDQEERIYRLRCVEGWSMVIPWLGFPLAKLLQEVEPTSNAQFVRFETLYDPDQMPGQQRGGFPWPYQEGLRIDEAMNDLAILSTGLYGKDLMPQNGAPVRLIVPWKYGFKSIKSIVKIELVEAAPATLWSTVAPHEYGFFANVNPDVSHPRWSQSSERRIGESSRRPTLLFNGYTEQVAHLYEGMDLSLYY